MGNIFVRERTKVGRGEGKPRFVVAATDGLDLKIYTMHLRKLELEALAEATGAEIVYLPKGDDESDEDWQESGEKKKKKKKKRKRD